MNTRIFFLSLVFIIATVILFAPTPSTATQSGTYWTWCWSDISLPVVYYSRLFDSGINAKVQGNFAMPLGKQFGEYVNGRFDVRGNASCNYNFRKETVELSHETFLAQLRKQNKQLVEVPDWNYVRDETMINASFSTTRTDNPWVDAEGGLPSDHIYCVAGPFNNTIYYAEPIALTNPSNNPTPGYAKFLQQKYSVKGNLNLICPILNEPHEKLYLNARLAGARAAGKQVVNTGWPPENFATTAEVPNDRYKDNDQASQRPAANQTAPSTEVREIAAKEVTPALAFCQSKRPMARGYNCACLQAKIYDYRIAHPADTLRGIPTLASFFDAKEFQCDKCINDSMAKMLAHDAAGTAGLRLPAAQDCVAQKFVASLHENPIPSQAQAELDGAIRACRQ
ncbi:MAG TPA: hypothetical protein VIX17_09860 [Pyrinomonadaceae bacterium]|jgi:hypothetical protein